MGNDLNQINKSVPERVKSIDFFRGFTMFLLMGESTGLYKHLGDINSNVMQFVSVHLDHHPWHGLYFWDLIQPFFMFIVGVAIPFSVVSRLKKGQSNKELTQHAIQRSIILFLCGWAIYCIDAGRIVDRFQNVLCQLGVAYLLAYLIRNKSVPFQIGFTIVLLLVTDLAYRFFPVAGFNRPWEPYHNLGAWVNNKIEGADKTSRWATINAIPTTAHTVWGVLCGQLLMSKRSAKNKIWTMIIAGLICLLVGYAIDFFNITPIIKRIATCSFVLVSGGWTILALCFCYWLIDVKKIFVKGSSFFVIVGMNCIFIYLFFSVGGSGFLRNICVPFTKALFDWSGQLTFKIMTDIVVWGFLWYICYWLYQKKIFIKI